MGFFSFVKPLATLAAGTFLGAGAAEAIGSLLGGDEETAMVPATTTALPVATEIGIAARKALTTPQATGALRTRTIVQTIDPAGRILKSKVHKGGVAVFQADVTAANRVARQVRKLDKRLPRKLVKETELTRLKNEVAAQALRDARDGRSCPPPRC